MSLITLAARKQKTGLQKKIAYVTRAVRYSTISKDDLAQFASADSGISRAQLLASFEALQQEIEQMLLNGHSIQLGDMGTLRFSISCKTVENREDLSTDLVRARRILFQPSPRLKQEIKNVRFETVVADDPETDPGD